MPIQNKLDKKVGKPFFRWGKKGHKYFYNPNSKMSKNKAYLNCQKQARAILWHQHLISQGIRI